MDNVLSSRKAASCLAEPSVADTVFSKGVQLVMNSYTLLPSVKQKEFSNSISKIPMENLTIPPSEDFRFVQVNKICL